MAFTRSHNPECHKPIGTSHDSSDGLLARLAAKLGPRLALLALLAYSYGLIFCHIESSVKEMDINVLLSTF